MCLTFSEPRRQPVEMNSRVKESGLLGSGRDFHFSAKEEGKILSVFREPPSRRGWYLRDRCSDSCGCCLVPPGPGGAELPRAERSRLSGSLLLAPAVRRPPTFPDIGSAWGLIHSYYFHPRRSQVIAAEGNSTSIKHTDHKRFNNSITQFSRKS